MAGATVSINIRALAKPAIDEITRVKNTLTGLTTSAGWKNVVMGVGVGAGVGAFNMATQAIHGMGDAVADAVRAAADEQAGIARLNTSLAANAVGWDGTTDAIERTLTAQQRQLAFSDGDQRASLALLVGATHDVSQSFDMMQTAMDLARFKGIDLQTASEALVRVESGQYRMLKSLGIVLKDGATQTEALAAVQAVAAGQASAYGATYQGMSESLGLAIEDLQEAIGTALLPTLKEFVVFLRDDVVPGLQSLVDWWQENRDTVNAFVLALIPLGTISGQVRERQKQLTKEYFDGAKAADTVAEKTAKFRDGLGGLEKQARRTGIVIGTSLKDVLTATAASAEQAWQRLNRLRGQAARLKDDLWDGAEAVRQKLQEERDAADAAASAADSITPLITQVREATASLRGLGGSVAGLIRTFSGSWQPTILTAAQAGAALNSATTGLNRALAGLKVGAESTRVAAVAAFEKMKGAALAYFDAVHRERLQQLSDVHTATMRQLADEQTAQQRALQSQIDAINAGVAAYKASLDAKAQARQKAALDEALLNAQGKYSDPLAQQVADAQKAMKERQASEQEAQLQANLTNARSYAERTAAQQALDDFYAQSNLDRLLAEQQSANAIQTAQQNLDDWREQEQLRVMQAQADFQTSQLQAQQQFLSEQYQQAVEAENLRYQKLVEAENLRYATQVENFNKLMQTTSESLENLKGVWDEHSGKVVSLLKSYTSKMKAVARGWMSAMQDAIDANPLTIPAPGVGGSYEPRAAGGPVTGGRPFLVGERGPELFVPGTSGAIVSNASLGGSGETVVHTVVQLDGRTIAELVDRHLGYKFALAGRTTGAI